MHFFHLQFQFALYETCIWHSGLVAWSSSGSIITAYSQPDRACYISNSIVHKFVAQTRLISTEKRPCNHAFMTCTSTSVSIASFALLPTCKLNAVFSLVFSHAWTCILIVLRSMKHFHIRCTGFVKASADFCASVASVLVINHLLLLEGGV